MDSLDLDQTRMQRALELAASVIGRTDPNPRVGCVLGTEGGALLGEGATQPVGSPHAEVMALRDAQSRGLDVRGATAWVTLEPCAHHGRTPPCCDALIDAGIRRVFVAHLDPNPLVAGAGIARMRQAGLSVQVAEGQQARKSRDLNIGFFSRMVRKRPWVRVKMAASLDGRLGLDNGVSQWITSEEARGDGHRWRGRSGAILTGIGTILADDPRLDVRSPGPIVLEQPLRVIVDTELRTPPSAKALAGPGKALIATTEGDIASRLRQRALIDAGAEILELPQQDGRPDLAALLKHLGKRGVNELHVEAGPRLNGSLFRAGLVDELLLYLAPRLLGGVRGLVDWAPLDRLDQGPEMDIAECSRVGTDLRLLLRAAGDVS